MEAVKDMDKDVEIFSQKHSKMLYANHKCYMQITNLQDGMTLGTVPRVIPNLEAEAGGLLQVTWLHSEFKISLEYIVRLRLTPPKKTRQIS